MEERKSSISKINIGNYVKSSIMFFMAEVLKTIVLTIYLFRYMWTEYPLILGIHLKSLAAGVIVFLVMTVTGLALHIRYESYPPVTAETAFTLEYLLASVRLICFEMRDLAKFQSGFIALFIVCIIFIVYSIPFITANIVYFAGYLLIGKKRTAEKGKQQESQ